MPSHKLDIDNTPSKARGTLWNKGKTRIAHIIMANKINVCVFSQPRGHDFICDVRQFFIQCGPEKPRGWTPLPVSELDEDEKWV